MAASARRPTPVHHLRAPWGCAGGRHPLPSPAPSGPQPDSSTRQRPPCTQNACAVRFARPVAPPPPCAAAAQATQCRRALPRCSTARRLPSPTGQRPPLQQARGRLQPAAGQGAARPDPSADRPTRRVPDADGHQLQQPHGRRRGRPAAHTPNSVIRQVFLSAVCCSILNS